MSALKPQQLLQAPESLLSTGDDPLIPAVRCVSDDWWSRFVTSAVAQIIGGRVDNGSDSALVVGRDPGLKLRVSTAPFAAGAANRQSAGVLIAGYDFVPLVSSPVSEPIKDVLWVALTAAEVLQADTDCTNADTIFCPPSLLRLVQGSCSTCFDFAKVANFRSVKFVSNRFTYVGMQIVCIAKSAGRQLDIDIGSDWPSCFVQPTTDESLRSLLKNDPAPKIDALFVADDLWLQRLMMMQKDNVIELGFCLGGITTALCSAGWRSVTFEADSGVAEFARTQRTGEVVNRPVVPLQGDLDNHGGVVRVGHPLRDILRSDCKVLVFEFNGADSLLSTLVDAELPNFVQVKANDPVPCLRQFDKIHCTSAYDVYQKKSLNK